MNHNLGPKSWGLNMSRIHAHNSCAQNKFHCHVTSSSQINANVLDGGTTSKNVCNSVHVGWHIPCNNKLKRMSQMEQELFWGTVLIVSNKQLTNSTGCFHTMMSERWTNHTAAFWALTDLRQYYIQYGVLPSYNWLRCIDAACRMSLLAMTWSVGIFLNLLESLN